MKEKQTCLGTDRGRPAFVMHGRWRQRMPGYERKNRMEIRYPEYYKKFRCLAGECPDTCCAGWEILVDKESEKRYRDVYRTDRRFGAKLRAHIRRGRIEGSGELCPFLDETGLCEIYRNLGEDSLCRTCKHHPRHVEDYGNLHEVVLLLSCPEVCRLVLEDDSGEYYVRERSGRQGNLDGIDGEFLRLLQKVRERAWEIGRNREIPMDERLFRVLALGHDVQGKLVRDSEKCVSFEEAYKVLGRKPGRSTGCVKGGEMERFLLMGDFMELLAELEPVGSLWDEMLEACRRSLYHEPDSRKRYGRDREQFLLENPGLSIQWERIFGYFLYSFLLAALYDGDLYTKIKMAVFCTLAIEELNLASWREQGAAVSVEDQIKICHVFARQMENSDGNRLELEHRLKGKEFGIRRVKTALSV